MLGRQVFLLAGEDIMIKPRFLFIRELKAQFVLALIILSIFMSPLSPIFSSSNYKLQARERVKTEKIEKKRVFGPYVVPEQDSELLRKFGMPAGTEPLVYEAIKMKLRELKYQTNAANINQYAGFAKTEPLTRRQIGVYLAGVCFDAVANPKRNEAEQKFYNHFQRYFAKIQQENARRTLQAWNIYKNNYSRERQNSATTLSVLFETGPTLDGFTPPPGSLNIGESGKDALASILYPAAAKAFPEVGLPEVEDAAMESLLTKIGIGVSSLSWLILTNSLSDDLVEGLLNRVAKAKAMIKMIRERELDNLEHDLKNAIKQNVREEAAEKSLKGKQQQLTKKVVQENADIAEHNKVRAPSKSGSAAKNVSKLSSKLAKLGSAGRLMDKIFGVMKAAMVAFLSNPAGAAIYFTVMMIPALLDAIMAIVAVVKMQHFEENLIKAAKGDDDLPDLYQMLSLNLVRQGKLCYADCRAGYAGYGFRCLKDCPDGFVEGREGYFCRRKNVIAKEVYSRGRGTAPARKRYYRGGPTRPKYDRRSRRRTCPSGTNKIGGLCYKSCRSGYRASGNYCVQRTSSCGNKEKTGGLCYTKCRSGFTGVGTKCRQTSCPPGYRDQGASCRLTGSNPQIVAKESYRRGIGQTGECLPADTRETNKLAMYVYLLKMLVSDPEDDLPSLPNYSQLKQDKESLNIKRLFRLNSKPGVWSIG